MSEFIASPVHIGFDPKTVNDAKLRKIFLDDTATTLWLAVRQEVEVSEHFGRYCRDCARDIRRNPPEDYLQLHRVLDEHFKLPEVSVEFAKALWPYIIGAKHLEYELSPVPGL